MWHISFEFQELVCGACKMTKLQPTDKMSMMWSQKSRLRETNMIVMNKQTFFQTGLLYLEACTPVWKKIYLF